MGLTLAGVVRNKLLAHPADIAKTLRQTPAILAPGAVRRTDPPIFDGGLMKKLLSLLCGVLSLFGLSACDQFVIDDLKPGVSTGFEVRDKLGPPGIEWRNEDGSVTWEYTQQPQGTTCYLITVDGRNIVQKVEQVLTEAQFARIQPGLNQDQVRRLLGKPAKTQYFQLKNETVWDWLIDNSNGAEPVFFNVYFNPKGQVVRTGRDIEYKGR